MDNQRKEIGFFICTLIILIILQSAFVSAEEITKQNVAGENSKEFSVGVLYWSMNIPGQVAMRKGLEKEAERINQAAKKNNRRLVKLIPNVAGDGNEGIDRQIRQMYDLIKQKVDLIIVQPTDIAALSKPLIKANEMNIPVVSYDQYIIGGKQISFLTSDNYQAGYLDGEYVAANFPNDKKLRIILVEYPHVSSTVMRVNGFMDALVAYKQPYTILKTYRAVEPESGRQAGRQILKDYPEKGSIDVVFTVNDGGGLEVVRALTKARRDEIFVATVDGDPNSVKIIREQGITRIDSAQFCGALGAETMKIGYKVLNGEKVPKHILIPVFPITRETVDMYKGWLAPIPKKFVKQWHSANPAWEWKLKIVEPAGE